MTDAAKTDGPTTADEIKTKLEKLPFAEKVLAPIALVILVGWIVKWSTEGKVGLLRSWFDTLSFFGALAVTFLVGAKLFGRRPLPAKLERLVIPIASLVPVVGYLIDIINPVHQFLTVGGSMALAYLSATTYWRKHIPEIATKPLDTVAPGEQQPQ